MLRIISSDSAQRKVFVFVGGIILGLVALLCLLPFIMVVSGSLSSEEDIIKNGYSVIPRKFSLDAYEALFVSPEGIFSAYRNTVLYTLLGTTIGLFITAMTGYVLCRQDFKWRNVFSYFFYFTTLFSGGLVPSYILMLSLGMKNNPLAIILPGLLSVFNIFIMRNFAKSIPEAITESAKIDGANDITIFVRLIFPLLKPALATIGLFLALDYWNSWYTCMLYITDQDLYTLQYYLYKMLNAQKGIQDMISQGAQVDVTKMNLPMETTKLAMACVATGPIILLYPFVQRFFVSGITIGSVKG